MQILIAHYNPFSYNLASSTWLFLYIKFIPREYLLLNAHLIAIRIDMASAWPTLLSFGSLHECFGYFQDLFKNFVFCHYGSCRVEEEEETIPHLLGTCPEGNTWVLI